MKRNIFVKLLFIGMVLFCVGCDYKKEPEPEVYVNNDIEEVNKPETDSEKVITHDFNHETNIIGRYLEWQFELPQDWNYSVDEEHDVMYFYPGKDNPPSFLLGKLESAEKYDLTDAAYQKAVTDAIIESYKAQMEECELISYNVPKEYIELASGGKIDITGTHTLCIKCSGIMNGREYIGDILVYYWKNQMYALNLFQYVDSKYDFYEDMCAIRGTFKLATEATESVDDEGSDDLNENSESADLSAIEVTFDKDIIDGNDMRLKVYVKNTSDKVFTGDIHVFFYMSDGKTRLGQDMLIVEDLSPGCESWSNVTIKEYNGTPKLELEYSNIVFEEVEETTAEMELTATEKTANSVRLNFDITSWYVDIKSIEVYEDGTCIVVSASHNDNSVIASSVWSCGHDYGVKTVQVIDEKGKVLVVYP